MSAIKQIFQSFIGKLELECPKYTTVATTDDYEERLYEAAKWTSTTISDTEHRSAVSAGFRKLFNYISGKNQNGVKIPMTAPVITKVEPGAGPFCESNFTVSFFVPFADQANPPEPTDPKVFNQTLPEMTAFVRSFGGYASDSDWIKHAEALANSLDKAGKNYHKEFYYTAGYNSPFQPIGRHNEVWFIQPDPPSQ